MDLKQGYHIERGFLNKEEINQLEAAFQEILERMIPPSNQILYTHELPATPRPHLKEIAEQWFNIFRKDLRNPIDKLYTKVNRFLDSLGLVGYDLFQDSFIQKVKTKTPFHWHQDYPFWPVDRPDGWTVWVAIDVINDQNGKIEIAANSNSLGIEPVVDLHTGNRQRGKDNNRFRPCDFDIICPDLEPGDALLFHALTYHYSKPNTSSLSRRAWASVWMGPEVLWDKSRAPRHFICKLVQDGEKISGFWK